MGKAKRTKQEKRKHSSGTSDTESSTTQIKSKNAKHTGSPQTDLASVSESIRCANSVLFDESLSLSDMENSVFEPSCEGAQAPPTPSIGVAKQPSEILDYLKLIDGIIQGWKFSGYILKSDFESLITAGKS